MKHKLTFDESEILSLPHNIADAHTHQIPSPQEQAAFVDALPRLFREAQSERGPNLDRRAFHAFMEASCQYASVNEWFLPTYSSSISCEIVANVVADRHRTVALTCPTFDNIADIFRRNRISLLPIPLDQNSEYCKAIQDVIESGVASAVFLVAPNNPTGHILTKEQFQMIASRCTKTNTLLIIDPCFRPFDSQFMFDQHEILQEEKTDYIVVEDTGKIWPTLDLKLSFICASPNYRKELELVHQDFLLNVPPIINKIVEAAAGISQSDDFQGVREIIEKNRSHLRERLLSSNLGISIPFPHSRISVELLDFPVDDPVAVTRQQGVGVLSADAFYWDRGPGEWSHRVRIALARSEHQFRSAIEALEVAFKKKGK